MLHIGMFGYDDTCIKIYDPSKPDGSKHIDTLNNYDAVSAKYGLRKTSIHRAVANKSRLFVEKLGIEVAIRLSKKEPNANIKSSGSFKGSHSVQGK